jgi:hypothetical protein
MIASLIAYRSAASENKNSCNLTLSSGCKLASYALSPPYSTDFGAKSIFLIYLVL